MRRQPKKKDTSLARPARRAMLKSGSSLPRELKFFDTALSWQFDITAEVPATGGQLVLIPQGDTQSTRDGRLARIKSVHIKAHVNLGGPSVAGDPAAGIEFYVIQDRQCNGAAAAVADVFTITGTSNLAGAFRNLNNSKRFRILKHWKYYPGDEGVVLTVHESSAGTFTSSNTSCSVDLFIPCDILVDWNSTTGAITEITQNNIFIIAGAGGNFSDDRAILNGNCRVRFEG